MILFVAPITLFVILVLIWRDVDFFVVLMSILWGLFLAVIIAGLMTIILSYEYEQIETTKLMAFAGESGFSGRFLLGSGQVESGYKYRYLSFAEDGGIIMGEVDHQDAVIYETEGTPRLEKWYPMYKSKIARILFASPLKATIYKIYIPPNSIVYEYNLEL